MFNACEEIYIPDGNETYFTEDGVLYSKTLGRFCLKTYPIRSDRREYTVKEGAISIEQNAFEGCTLKEVVCPSTLDTLWPFAFSGSEVEKITFSHENYLFIGNRAFEDCSKLKQVIVPESCKIEVREYSFYNCSSLVEFPTSQVKRLMEYSFANCGLRRFEISEFCAFSEAKYCFYNSNVQEVHIANTLEYTSIMPNYMFADSALVKIELGDLESLSTGVFSGCLYLKSVNLKDFTEIQDRVFEKSGIQSVFSNNVVLVGDYAFDGAKDLQMVTLPNVVWINMYAFQNTALKEAVFEKAGEVGHNAFAGCTQLKNAKFAEKVRIDSFAFEDCESLESFESTIENKVVQGAFKNCKALRQVCVEGDMVTIEARAFEGCNSLERWK